MQVMEMSTKHRKKMLKIKLWRLMDKYGFFQEYKHREWQADIRDRMFIDFVELCEWYREVMNVEYSR